MIGRAARFRAVSVYDHALNNHLDMRCSVVIHSRHECELIQNLRRQVFSSRLIAIHTGHAVRIEPTSHASVGHVGYPLYPRAAG